MCFFWYHKKVCSRKSFSCSVSMAFQFAYEGIKYVMYAEDTNIHAESETFNILLMLENQAVVSNSDCFFDSRVTLN